MRPVPAEINHPARGGILLVGRDPGENEVDYRAEGFPDGRPFVGPSGAELERVLSATGLRRQDVNIANVCGYRPPDNEFKRHDDRQLQEGLADLRNLVDRLRPRLIITLGNEASYAILGANWPTGGRGIYGAKGINERRGYFWPGPHGSWVLSTLHPSGVLHQPVPGSYLLETDFRRARKWLRGELPREYVPEAKRLDPFNIRGLLSSSLVAWDIETKWGMTSLCISGFCGDDLVPIIGKYPKDKGLIWNVLQSQVRKVGHNGDGFDVPLMQLHHKLRVQSYTDDTQHMWWALEPELAGGEEESEEGDQTGSRMTRKALGVMATVYDFNVEYWKDGYPNGPDDPDHDAKLWRVNSFDNWITRQLASSMLPEIKKQKVEAQYLRSMELVPWAVEQHLRGMLINDKLRLSRIETLETRSETLKSESAKLALEYIERHEIAYFRDVSQCECCNGGKLSAKACWRCAGMPRKPEEKADYLGHWMRSIEAPKPTEEVLKAFKKVKVAALKAMLPECRTCGGLGKVTSYHFNPMSVPQMQYLLYNCLGVPKTYQKGKVMTDEHALRKVLRWALTGGKGEPDSTAAAQEQGNETPRGTETGRIASHLPDDGQPGRVVQVRRGFARAGRLGTGHEAAEGGR